MSAVLKPRLSEKSYFVSQKSNTFIIDVPAELNKHEIAAEVAKQFDVKVVNVRTVSRKGKSKRTMNLTGKRYSNSQGTQASIKKAYVTLAADSHLPFFEAEEAEVKEAEKAAKKSEKKTEVKASAKTEVKAANKTAHRGLLRNRKTGDK